MQKLKEAVKKDIEASIDSSVNRTFTDDESYSDAETEEEKKSILRKRKLDEIFERAPLYMTRRIPDDEDTRLTDLTPSDIQKPTVVKHGDVDPFETEDHIGLYSDAKDSFMIRDEFKCLYFQLTDDAKRRMIRRYIKHNLNVVAEMVHEENQKLFETAKASFDVLSQNQGTVTTPDSQ